MKKFVLMGLAALAVSGAWAITATKEYVDRSTNAVLVASKAETAAATNATLAASNAYTDAEIEKAGSVMPGVVTNIAGVVTSNVVTKAYVEDLGVSAGLKTNDVNSIIASSNLASVAYVDGATGAVVATAKEYTDGATNLVARMKDASGNEVCADLTAKVATGGFTDNWEPSETTMKVVTPLGSCYFNGIAFFEMASGQKWHAIRNWYEDGEWHTFPEEMQGDITNPNATTLTFPEGTVTHRVHATRTTRLATTNDIPTTAEQIGAATPEYVDEQNQATRAIVESWEGFLDGSNVVFSITNYISGAYNLNAAKLKILEMTNGVYREVYNSRDEIVMHIDNFRTNDFRIATNDVITSVDSKIADKADRAWGKYTSAGGVAPSNTVYMTAPSTVFAGGLEYERVAVGEGAVGILTTHGAPVYTTGDEGTFKFQDDGGTNYFGFAKTDSYVIGCNTDGISVQNNIVTLTYNVTMSGVPCIWYCPSLDVHPIVWEQLNTPDGQPIAGASHTVTWEEPPAAGTEVCYLNCPEAKGFFKATIEVAGSAKFMTNMPADLLGGIICTNTATGVNGIIRPSFNGSSVSWTWSGL